MADKKAARPLTLSFMCSSLQDGVLTNNPVLVQMLGLCATLATSTSVSNGLGMGFATTAVLICSNVVVSLLRRLIPSKIRIAAYVVIIAAFVSAVDMALQAFLPDIASSLGLYIPLIVVNCIILARAESFASKNTVGRSAVDGLGMGLGFTVVLVALGFMRELLGSGKIFGFDVTFGVIKPASLMSMAPGGFFALAILLALVQHFTRKKGGKKE